jgi:hypothetical protein
MVPSNTSIEGRQDMRYMMLLLLCAVGCGGGTAESRSKESTIDASRFEESIDAVKAGLTREERAAFEDALKTITFSEVDLGQLMVGDSGAPMRKLKDTVHGMTAKEVLAEAKRAAKRAKEHEFDWQKSANEAAAISSLRTLSTVSEQYRNRNERYPSDIQELMEEGLIGSELASGEKNGYTFKVTGSIAVWSCQASPQQPGQTGDRYFFVDQTGVLRLSADGPATAASDPIN